MSRKHSSWKDNEIVYCHLFTRNLASFSERQFFDGPTCRGMSSPRFSLLYAFKLSAYHVQHTKFTRSTAQKVDIRYHYKTSFVYCSLNNVNPYTFKYLNNGGSIQNDNTDSKCEIFYQMPRSQSAASQPI